MHLPHTVRLAAITLVLATLAACSGTATPATSSAPAGTAVAVEVIPGSPTVAPNAQLAFTAVVTGTVNTAVTWAVREPVGGTVDGAGRYVAPSGGGLFHVVATSVADPAASATAAVTVTAPPPPVVVTVTPSSGAVDACQSLALAATVTGTPDQAVTWSVQEGAAGGVVSASGVYTAPATGGTYHVVAASAADPTRTATVAVTVTERVLSVEVTPATVTVVPGSTTQFTATVTTTCGSFASAATVGPTGLVTAN